MAILHNDICGVGWNHQPHQATLRVADGVKDLLTGADLPRPWQDLGWQKTYVAMFLEDHPSLYRKIIHYHPCRLCRYLMIKYHCIIKYY